MSSLEQRLLNNYQRNFPLVPEPYEQLASELGSDSQTVRDLLAELLMRGKVSRVGPVFKPRMLGSSTLAAMSVPQEMLTEVATLVNGYPEVNHNYEREHRLNLWFVAVAADQEKLEQVLSDIESRSGYEVMSLPLLKEYHIDLGFRMDAGDKQRLPAVRNRIIPTAALIRLCTVH
ncbi:Lrp/AsnC family transcriptional regulator [Aliamphritea spongicola]|nr:Lrp/AsnC family transcriptional regulator [Aliamphritea spongicola]